MKEIIDILENGVCPLHMSSQYGLLMLFFMVLYFVHLYYLISSI